MNESRDPNVTADNPPVSVDPDLTTDHARGSASTDGSQPGADERANVFPTVPGYRVLREIARGGMGRVLAAVDLALDREVALKILLPGANSDRFVRESKITARLPHPGIPPVYAIGTLADGSPFLAMKLIDGQTLAVEMKTAERPRMLQTFTQVCQSVGFAHSRGVIHRDLKPANIMVGAFGEVQVMDWGLARSLSADDDRSVTDDDQRTSLDARQSTMTHMGQVMGTPAYMAPEQARGESTDARADVFALGGILCTILTGNPPFRGKSTHEVIARAGAADLADTQAELDSCGADAELTAICKRCLNASPADRPADGAVVAELMAEYRAGVEQRLRAAELDRAAAATKAAERLKRRRVWIGAAAILAFVALGGLGAVLAVQRRANTELTGKNNELAVNNQALAEEKARELAQRTLAETRLNLLRDALESFVNELPLIGENNPLAGEFRQELLAVSNRLIQRLQGKGDLGSMTEFSAVGLRIREGEQALARGEYKAAIDLYRQARDELQRILVHTASKDKARNNLAQTHKTTGDVLAAEKKFAEAEAEYEESLKIRRGILESPNGDLARSVVKRSIGDSLVALAKNSVSRGRPEAALAQYDAAEPEYAEAAATEANASKRDGLRMRLGTLSNERATTASQLGRTEEARAGFEAAVARFQDELRLNPKSASLQLHLSRVGALYGDELLLKLNDPEKAAAMYELSQKQIRDVMNSPSVLELTKNISLNYYRLGMASLRANRSAEAKAHFQRCLEVRDRRVHDLEEAKSPPNGTVMIYAKIDRMLAYGRTGMHVEAAKTATGLLLLAEQPGVPPDLAERCCRFSATGFALCSACVAPGSPEQKAYWQKGVASLRKAVAISPQSWAYIVGDLDMDPIRESPEYKEFLKERKK